MFLGCSDGRELRRGWRNWDWGWGLGRQLQGDCGPGGRRAEVGSEGCVQKAGEGGANRREKEEVSDYVFT